MLQPFDPYIPDSLKGPLRRFRGAYDPNYESTDNLRRGLRGT